MNKLDGRILVQKIWNNDYLNNFPFGISIETDGGAKLGGI